MNNEYFWSIVIEQDLVQVALWTIKGEVVSIITSSNSFKWETDEDLVEKVDAALSEAAESIPEEVTEPSKTVFGVPSSWVEEGKIKKPHLDKIRLVSQKLSLSPTGFVVLPEAIAHGVKVREGSPLSGVVIGVGKGSLDVTVFRLGNIVGTVSVGRSASLIEDMVEGLSRFAGAETVPTRWLLYDGKEVDLGEIKQELIKADWQDVGQNLKFLHTPQVEITSERDKVEAVSIAGASEMGEIKGIEGAEVVTDKNVSEAELSPADLGFVVDQDIRKVTEPAPALAPKKELLPSKFLSLFSFIKKIRFKPSVGIPGKKHIGLVLATITLLVSVGAIVLWIYLSRAEVVINISPKNLEEAEVVILDENIGSAEPENFTFPATSIEVEVQAEKSKSTTGTKTVGDRAKGKITIRNGTADEVDFESGTKVSGPGDLEFTVDEAVSVPGASSPTTPGTASVAVTAAVIGAEHNIAKDESFSVTNFPKSEVDAVSEDVFSGGSSREVRAISESDVKSLNEELIEDARAKALLALEREAASAQLVVDATKYEVVDESVSGSAGEEADSVTISITLNATGLVITGEQMRELSSIILQDQVPEGFSLKSDQVVSDFQLMDEIEEGVWEFDVSLAAKLLPSVDTDQIKKDIAGKPKKFVEEYLARIPGYNGATITVRPPLPGFLGNIPRLTKNIFIEITASQ